VPPTTSLVYTTIKTPVGRLGLAATEAGLCRLDTRLASEKDFVDRLKKLHPRPRKNPAALTAWITEIENYFAGKPHRFSGPLDLSAGTPFQRKVWKKLQTIPHGETRSYEWLARAIGQPRGYRAVGNANGKNPVSLIVPCHRVVRKSGDLGGYALGPEIKRFLLNLEQAAHGPV
jgi:O-6-methylguanine DNA methyltransferase